MGLKMNIWQCYISQLTYPISALKINSFRISELVSLCHNCNSQVMTVWTLKKNFFIFYFSIVNSGSLFSCLFLLIKPLESCWKERSKCQTGITWQSFLKKMTYITKGRTTQNSFILTQFFFVIYHLLFFLYLKFEES